MRVRVARGRGAAFAGIAFPFARAREAALAGEGAAAPVVRDGVSLYLEAFAVAREGARRVLGQRPYKVQLMGGAALHLGQVAEMKTGEGKTLTCVLPAYLNAIRWYVSGDTSYADTAVRILNGWAAAVNQLAPASPEPNTSPEVAPK